jgi:uncharacterized protein YciI
MSLGGESTPERAAHRAATAMHSRIGVALIPRPASGVVEIHMPPSTRALVLGACLLGQAPGCLAAPETLVDLEGKVAYLLIYRPGPAWLAGKPVADQPLREHGRYMLGLYVRGSMKLAGPLMDDAGGAVLLLVPNESEARDVVANDPAVKTGVLVPELHPWKLQPWHELAARAQGAVSGDVAGNR